MYVFIYVHVVHVCYGDTPDPYCRPRWPKAYWATWVLTECLGQQYVACYVGNLQGCGADLMRCGGVAMFWLEFLCLGWGSKLYQTKVLSESVSSYSLSNPSNDWGAVVLVWFGISSILKYQSLLRHSAYASFRGRLRLRQCGSFQAQAVGERLWQKIHRTNTREKHQRARWNVCAHKNKTANMLTYGFV